MKKGAESLAALGPGTYNLARKGILQQQLTSPFEAPRMMFNVPIGGARRFAAQSWPFERFRAVKKAAGVTINAQGPLVNFKQAPPQISINAPISITMNGSDPNAVGAAVSGHLNSVARGALHDGVTE